MVYVAKNTEETQAEETQKDCSEQEVGTNLNSVLDQVSPKTALLVGMVGAIMTLCSIGFVVLAYFVFAR